MSISSVGIVAGSTGLCGVNRAMRSSFEGARWNMRSWPVVEAFTAYGVCSALANRSRRCARTAGVGSSPMRCWKSSRSAGMITNRACSRLSPGFQMRVVALSALSCPPTS